MIYIGKYTSNCFDCVCDCTTTDFMRCSVTFPTVASLLKWMKIFVDKVENGEVDCLSKILRIKNGFKSVPTWKTLNDCEYVDIKV